MVTQELFDEITRRLVQAYDPEAIYLFGSYAWGSPTEDSDVDLAIVVREAQSRRVERPRSGFRALYSLGISKDILVYTKEEFDKAVQHPSALAKKILTKGRMLYAKA